MCEKYPEEWEHTKELDASNPSTFNPKYTLKDVEDAVHDQMVSDPNKRKEININALIASAKEKCMKCDFI